MNFSYIIDKNLSEEIISEEFLREIYYHARQTYPEECCGLVLKQGIRKCKNFLQKYHIQDPINYPRTAKEGFVFSPEDSLFLSKNLCSDNPVKVIYHSHPNVGAYFSDEDKKNALIDGEPIYPVDHLVIDIQNEEIICSKLFRFIAGDYQLIAILPGQNF